jgi:hypothetical protein
MRPLFVRLALFAVFTVSAAPLYADEPPLTAELVSVARIWEAGQHNAFTDLLRHQERWYCVFREGAGHVSEFGKIRVLSSADGQDWQSLALLSSSDGDLRDAKLSVTPGGKLMLTTVLATPKDEATKHQSRVYLSDDGVTWEGPHDIGDKNFWLWRTTWHDAKAYNIGYATHGERKVRLYQSEDGKTFTSLVDDLGVKNEYPNESALGWKDDGTAICLLRCEKPSLAQLGTAAPPYKEWTWKELDQPLGGPALIRHESGRWLAAGRIYKPSVHTSLCWLDTDNHKLVELAKLPSGGDTSYPGLVWHDNLLWMSYYSSHEGKTSIYLAKLRVTVKK